MRGWSFAGGVLSCLWLAFGCGEDSKQTARGGAAGLAGAASAAGGSEHGGGGSSPSAGDSLTGGLAGGEQGGAGVAQFLPLYENGSRLRAISLGEPGSSDRKLLAWHDSE